MRGAKSSFYTKSPFNPAPVAHPKLTMPFLPGSPRAEGRWRGKLATGIFVGHVTVAPGGLLRAALAVSKRLAVTMLLVAGYEGAAAHLATDGAQPLAVNELADAFAVAWHHLTEMRFQTMLTKSPRALGIFTGKHRSGAFDLHVLTEVTVFVVLAILALPVFVTRATSDFWVAECWC